MKTKTRSKPLIGMTALSLLVGLSLASNSEVKNDLSHTVQSIHQVIFTSNTKPENQKTVELKADGSQVQIQGKVLNTSAGMGNSLSQNSKNSQIYYGKKNSIAGSNSAILYGRNNTIEGNQNAIIGGYKNEIWSSTPSSANNVIIGGRGNKIDGNKSIIIGGWRNIINGANNLILAGKQKTINGNNTYVLGSNIKNPGRDNNFIWSDNKIRKNNRLLSPRSSNSFIIRSANGVAINTSTPLGQGVTINGMVQLANENLTCDANTLGAMKFEEITKDGKPEGCFFACEKHGSEIKWFPMAKEACGAKEVAPKNPENPVTPAPTPINGQCAPIKNTCTVGTVKNQGENSTHFTWQCEGSNGGSSASCSLEKPAAPVVPTCSIELRGNHINGDRIEVPANGFQYQIDGYTISTQGNQWTYQIQLDNSWTNSEPHTWTNDGRIVYFGKFDNGQSVRFDINNTWQGNFPIRIKNIVDGKVLCERSYTVVKDQVPEGPQSCNLIITFTNTQEKNVAWNSTTRMLYIPAEWVKGLRSNITANSVGDIRGTAFFRLSENNTSQYKESQGNISIDYPMQWAQEWSINATTSATPYIKSLKFYVFDSFNNAKSQNEECLAIVRVVQCGPGTVPTERGCQTETTSGRCEYKNPPSPWSLPSLPSTDISQWSCRSVANTVGSDNRIKINPTCNGRGASTCRPSDWCVWVPIKNNLPFPQPDRAWCPLYFTKEACNENSKCTRNPFAQNTPPSLEINKLKVYTGTTPWTVPWIINRPRF